MFQFKRFISLSLIWCMLVPSIGLSSTSANENPYEAPIGSTCIGQEQTLTEGNSCCYGLELNPNSLKCDEPTLKDTGLVSCITAATCGVGAGCFPQRATDLFSALSPGGEDTELNAIISSQIDDEGSKATGVSCQHSRECNSYSCVAGSCENKMVCRYAADGEMAVTGIDCGDGLIKTPSGICAEVNNSQGVYLGLVNEVKVIDGGQCRFDVDEDTREKSLVAMKSLRAMEWLFANISVAPEDECFRVLPILKDTIGKSYVNSRKNILANFTEILNGIETDFKTLIYSKEKSPEIVSMHSQEILEGDLATRQTSGYDSLLIMYRRNLLFQSYEQTMLDTVQKTSKAVQDLSLGQASWQSSETKWKIGNQTIQAYNCNGSKYKKWKPFSWKTKYYNTIKDRWSHYYEVNGTNFANASIVKRDNVAEYLALLGGISKEAAIDQFTKSKYYLLDPLLHGGLNFDSYGEKKSLSSSGFLGLGRKDLRQARYLKGTANGSYTTMYNNLKQKVRDFYGSLKVNKDQKNFIFEPELVTVAAKDCIKTPGNPKCEEFDKFLEVVLDQGFAQFLAYSASARPDYTGYFTNSSTWRRRLLSKLEVDMQNISKYYQKVIELRDQQNTCIEKVINGVIENGILANGSETGVLEGQSVDNKINSKVLGDTVKNFDIEVTQRDLSLRPQKLTASSRDKYRFNLDTALNKDFSQNSLKDNLASGPSGSSSSNRGGIGSGELNSTLALRQRQMLDANNMVSKGGSDLSAKEQSTSASIKKIAAQSSRSGSGLSMTSSALLASSSPGVKDLQSGNGKAELMKEANSSDINIEKINTSASPRIGIHSHSGGNGSSGLDSNREGNSVNALSEAEKAAALLNEDTDKTGKKRYGSNDGSEAVSNNREEDVGLESEDLFKLVSQAYVRNLKRVLHRKKLIK